MVERDYAEEVPATVIQPLRGWQLLDFKELSGYRDLLFFLAWRDVRIHYAQTVLGIGWAFLTPLIQIVVFTIIFGRVAKIPTDGVPYVLFTTVAVIPWTYMADAMTQSSQSLVTGQHMLGKIYFPRLIYPLTPVLTRLVDFGIALLIITIVLVYYRVPLTWNLLYLPLFMFMMMAVPLAVGLWLSSLSIRFRDVRFAMQFLVRMLIYSAPIVYSSSRIPAVYRQIYSLNPIVGVIEGYRACLLGQPLPWPYILPGMMTVTLLLISGALYFKRMEQFVVDVI
jgi:homopolymeric O-antigen transport system permease protein